MANRRNVQGEQTQLDAIIIKNIANVAFGTSTGIDNECNKFAKNNDLKSIFLRPTESYTDNALLRLDQDDPNEDVKRERRAIIENLTVDYSTGSHSIGRGEGFKLWLVKGAEKGGYSTANWNKLLKKLIENTEIIYNQVLECINNLKRSKVNAEIEKERERSLTAITDLQKARVANLSNYKNEELRRLASTGSPEKIQNLQQPEYWINLGMQHREEGVRLPPNSIPENMRNYYYGKNK